MFFKHALVYNTDIFSELKDSETIFLTFSFFHPPYKSRYIVSGNVPASCYKYPL